ncbi:hypothetical protein A3732_18170, partial [Oleiphilus sp. HI0050]
MGKYQAYPEYVDSGTQWLGEIPADWELFDGKRLFKNRREPSLETDEQLAASQKYGVVPQSLMMKLNDSKVMLALKGTSSFRHVEENDFVISLRSFEGGIEHSKYVGCVSPAYTVLSSVKDIAPKFYRYLFKSKPYIAALQSTTDSLRDGKSITFEQFGAIPLVLPQFEEQEKIANFLDHETAKIDTLIEKQQQLIKLLKEKRQAVISHAVTKGLNPSVPMRDSGVEWLGEVPEHWEVKKFKYLCDRIIAGPFGSSITKDMYVKNGYKVYGQEQVIPNDFEIGDYYINEKDYTELSRYIVGEGDILISCVGTFGKIAVFPEGAEPGIINPRLIKAEICQNHNPYYIRELLKSEMVFKQFELLSRGGTMGVINIAILSEILAAVPPENEQSEVVEYINQQKEKFSSLIDQANKAVQLLQERRTALISAAVTGKIDVRSWRAPEPSDNQNKEVA